MLREATTRAEAPPRPASPRSAEPDVIAEAKAAGLRYVSDAEPGITRRRSGKGWSYRDPSGRPIRDKAEIERLNKLAIPPAYQEVWICPQANGHLQATGRDARGRKQYRYHPDWRSHRDANKYHHVMRFARALPTLRARVRDDMAQRGLGRDKVLATVVHLLDTTLIRVGNDDYAQSNQSYGLTTLKDGHVAVKGQTLRFNFRGKSGKEWRLSIQDRRVARTVRACQDLPGQALFQYLDEAGERHSIDSSDVNEYLREATGEDITAKDFRTWAGTVLAALALSEFERFDSEAAAKRNLKAAIEHTAARLGNTPTICRQCYVHPEVLGSYLTGELALQVKREVEAELREELPVLKPEEAAVLAFLRRRLSAAAKA
ncbi:DNA topoisomerase IB [Teichococcus vastitatis]|uniref:DNA topoisomerase n=1 Tax=Teichococcus vastitatis TaxID=2307076 RepID=A0ABS9W106_9PROT|nr:DNA topoisomerase IB [Pseudoroseomonas vastitatis]MCI0752590.1 DNA topoisomerase IB [Pseudoroseomonas vastitatis]